MSVCKIYVPTNVSFYFIIVSKIKFPEAFFPNVHPLSKILVTGLIVPFSLINCYIRIPQLYESHCRIRKFSIIRIRSILVA